MILKFSSLTFSMTRNLKKGYNVHIYDGYYTLIDRNRKFIIKVKMAPNHLFLLKVHHEHFSYLSSVILNYEWLRHMRFGTFSLFLLNYLSRKMYVIGFPIINIPNGVCKTCEIGKNHRESFPTGKLGYTFCSKKPKVCNAFKTFKEFIEKQSECRIKALRIDKGQEYLAFKNFFEQYGI
ncbi:hypothetical protein CR513_36455, partial [Mucuna pruriens]